MRLYVTGNALVAVRKPATMQTVATEYCSSAAGAEVRPTHIEGKTYTQLGAQPAPD
jgi:hypothetical protein